MRWGDRVPLRVVVDCSLSGRKRLVHAGVALTALARAAGAVQVYAFPGKAEFIYKVYGRVTPESLERLPPGSMEEWLQAACGRASDRLGTPLARAVYEAATRVYKPGDDWRTVVLTDGECTSCGEWLGRLRENRSWAWRVLVVLVEDPAWLRGSKYRRRAEALLRLLAGGVDVYSVEEAGVVVTLQRLLRLGEISLKRLLEPVYRMGAAGVSTLEG